MTIKTEFLGGLDARSIYETSKACYGPNIHGPFCSVEVNKKECGKPTGYLKTESLMNFRLIDKDTRPEGNVMYVPIKSCGDCEGFHDGWHGFRPMKDPLVSAEMKRDYFQAYTRGKDKRKESELSSFREKIRGEELMKLEESDLRKEVRRELGVVQQKMGNRFE